VPLVFSYGYANAAKSKKIGTCRCLIVGTLPFNPQTHDRNHVLLLIYWRSGVF